MRFLTHRTSVLLFLVLAACGGSGSGGSDPGPDDVPGTGLPDATDLGGPADAADAATTVDASDTDPTAVDPGAGADSGEDTVAPVDAAMDGSSDPDVFVPGPHKKSLPLYDETVVVDFKLTFADAEWKKFDDFYQKYKQNPELWVEDTDIPYVHCGFEFADETFPDAACRPKANPLYWKDQPKPQMLVRFDEWDDTGRFKGQRKLNLEASPYHAAPVRDRLAMWVQRESGIDAPRVNHARVFINGELLGLYQNIEVLDHEFLETHYPDPSGNLYENGYILKTNKKENDLTRIWDLNDRIDDEPLEGDHSTFFAWLPTLMDVPQVLKEMAGEVVLPATDNFTTGSWNFYYYDCPGRGFLVIPWDMDGAFRDVSLATSDLYAFWGPPDNQNPPNKLRQLIYQNPAWKKAFEDELVAIRDGAYAKLAGQVDAVCAQIRPYVDADPNKAHDLAAFDADCADIKDQIAARIAYIKATLGR